MLSGYRLMWMIVMFDLPVVRKADRKAAAEFRKYLLDQGFEMSQFSVYLRFCSSPAQVDTYVKKIQTQLPRSGKVHILQMTDKQYERVISFHGRAPQAGRKAPEQFDLF